MRCLSAIEATPCRLIEDRRGNPTGRLDEGRSMDDYLTGTIMLFGGNFAPRNWKCCDGQLLAIAEYAALFSLLGTQYGGDGRTTFALPDLRGRAPIGMGQGPGLSRVNIGQSGGNETTYMTENNLPSHTHSAQLRNAAVQASSGEASSDDPVGNVPAVSHITARGVDISGQIYGANADKSMQAGAVTGDVEVDPSGWGQPIDNRSPFLGINYIICVSGIYPSRD